VASDGKAVSDGRLSARGESNPRAPAGHTRRLIGRPLIAAALTLALLVFVLGLYVVCLYETVGGPAETASDLNARDSLYFGIHGFFLLIAATTGFSLGKWINGLGVAFAVLLLVSTATAMVGTQVASYELACSGHNDLVRHWEC
jgi:hypothetical protein